MLLIIKLLRIRLQHLRHYWEDRGEAERLQKVAYTELREFKAMHVYMDEQVKDTSDVGVVHSEEVNVLKFRVYVWRVLCL